uniref:Uncharacterized protein n=1 Tax=viral metagenome TaxID=1070528 RepID=A0A6C0H4G0_9ZZZZ
MVSMKYRCACITLKGRRCQKAFSFVCNKTKCCTIHTNAYLTYVLTIQKAYKGWHCRKYVRLLARLPCDIQRNIVYYMREPLYNARRNKCIQALLTRKFVMIFGTHESIWSGFIVTNVNAFLGDYKSRVLTMNKTQFNDHVLDIAHLHKLYIKYMSITDTEYNNMLFHITNIVNKHIQECLYYYHRVGGPYLYSDAEMLMLHNNMTKLQNSISVYKFEYKVYIRKYKELCYSSFVN